MSTIVKLLFGACAVIVMLDAVSAIECYECSTTNNKGACGDENFSSTKTVTSQSFLLNLGDCKYCGKSKGKSLGVTHIERTCMTSLGDDDVPNTCIEQENILGYGEVVCVCSTDRCNGVGKLSGSILLALMVTMGKYLL